MATGVVATRHASQRARIMAVATLVLANVLWAGTYTAGKIALRELTPITLNALRFLIAALVLSPVLIRQPAAIVASRQKPSQCAKGAAFLQ